MSDVLNDSEKLKILDNIGLIALDLDRTTLASHSVLTENTRACLEEAISRGFEVVIATGRPLIALPKELNEINDLRYVICSNGAKIVDFRTGEFIYSNCISEEASRWCMDYLREVGYPVEVFTDGKAYISKERYEHFQKVRNTPEGSEYILTTRSPVGDIWEFWKRHIDAIENVNIIITDMDEKQALKEKLEELNPGFTLTSSMAYNLEIGGETTSKASGLKALSDLTGIPLERTMSFGDSPNDSAMIEESGFGVAMANALDEVKEVSDYVTLSNDEDGVAHAIRKLLFREEV